MFILFQCHWSIVPMYWDQNRDSVILLFTTPTGFVSSAILPRLLSSTLQLKIVNEGTEDRVLWRTTRDFPQSWTCTFESALGGLFQKRFSVLYMWN